MADEKLSPQEAVVKRYLEEQVQNDEALGTLYVPAKIKECFNYIKEQAKKKAVNGCAMVEDSLVYKWARDYYLEELSKKADKETVAAVQDKADNVRTEQKEVTVVKDGRKTDTDGNGLLFDID